jgi:hypothetical protein
MHLLVSILDMSRDVIDLSKLFLFMQDYREEAVADPRLGGLARRPGGIGSRGLAAPWNQCVTRARRSGP